MLSGRRAIETYVKPERSADLRRRGEARQRRGSGRSAAARVVGQVAIPVEPAFADEAHQVDLVLRQLGRSTGVLDLGAEVLLDRGGRELPQPVSDPTHLRTLA